jgi:hypothetical protein
LNAPSDDPASPRRFWSKPAYWLGGSALVLLLLFLWQLFGPNPAIYVSPQTTYLIAPLRADGMPDYNKWLLERQRQGVTPENNAAVLMWQATGPDPMVAGQFALLCAEIGIGSSPSRHDRLQEVNSYRRSNRKRFDAWCHSEEGKAGSSEEATRLFRGFYMALDQTLTRPWTSAEIPPMADWIAENQRPLDLLVAASQRPRYYSPSPSLLDGMDEMLLVGLIPEMNSTRSAARGLTIRAMWHLGEGRTEEAWHDLLAVCRLARLVGTGERRILASFIAIAMDYSAMRATQSLLGQGDLTVEFARRVRGDLVSLPSCTSMADSLDCIERIFFLDVAIKLAAGEIDESDPFFHGSNLPILALHYTNIDWNIVLLRGNHWFDRVARAAALPIRGSRQKALDKIDDDIAQRAKPVALTGSVMSRRSRTELMAAVIAKRALAITTNAMAAEDRANTQLELVRLAAALAVFRAEQGRYPVKLETLVPDIVDALPLDIYSGKPFVYKPDADGAGYVLYSVSLNGMDDGGTDSSGEIINGEWVEKRQNVDWRSASDLVIRLPVPPLKLPEVAIEK